MSAWCLLAGALLGASHVTAAGGPLAWAGFILLAYALDDGRSGSARTRLGRAVGVLVAALLTESIADAWLASTASTWIGLSALPSVALAAVACVLMGAMLAGPSVVAAVALPARWGGAWLPLTWALGEALRGRVSGVTTSDWLNAHWQSERSLHALHWLGWHPTLLAGLAVATTVGMLVRRGPPLAAASLLAVALGAPVPAVRSDPGIARGVALVQVAGAGEAPREVPPGVDLLVWPESAFADHPTLAEGAVEGVHLDLPVRRPGLWHLVGLITFTPRGDAQNSACLVDPSGALVRCRAKRDLVPVGERRFLRLRAGDGFLAGEATPFFRANGRPLVPLVCLEATHLWTMRRGVEAGGAMVVVLASDRPIAASA